LFQLPKAVSKMVTTLLAFITEDAVRAEYSFDAGVASQVCLPLVVRQGSVQEIRVAPAYLGRKFGRNLPWLLLV
jgi:hypothetical protein